MQRQAVARSLACGACAPSSAVGRQAPSSSSTILVAASSAFLASAFRSYSSLDDTNSSSILGTSTMSHEFMQTFRVEAQEQAMIAEEERRTPMGGGIAASCIRKGEMDHLESPAADQRFESRLDKQVAELFAKIPEPKDPMKMARKPTADEVVENERFEMIKEAMREKYNRQKSRQRSESERIESAMQAVEEGTYERKFQRERPAAVWHSRAEQEAMDSLVEPENMERLKLLQELEATKAKMRALQEELDRARKQKSV